MHILSMITLQKPNWHTQNFLEGKGQLCNALTSAKIKLWQQSTSTAVAIVILGTSQGEEGSVQFAAPPEKGS